MLSPRFASLQEANEYIEEQNKRYDEAIERVFKKLSVATDLLHRALIVWDEGTRGTKDFPARSIRAFLEG